MSDTNTTTAEPQATWTMRRSVAFYVAGLLVMSLTAGLLWHLLASPPNYTIGDDKGAIITERGLSQIIAMDIWYVVIGIVFGLLLGGLSWGMLRRVGWPIVLIAVAGALLAALMAWQFGHLLGPRDFATRVGQANPGDRVPMDLDLHSAALILVWPLAAAVAILLAALWGALRPHRPID